MRFWFARNSDVPIREQIVTQVVLGILCGDLEPGERLPSTRELARRFHLHPNTISAAYRQLQRDLWVELRRGSGAYIRERRPNAPVSSAIALDQLIANLLRSARELGVSLSTVHSHLRRTLASPPDHFLLIEADEELRNIIAAEIRQAVTLPVTARGLAVCGMHKELEGAIAVTLPSNAEAVRHALPPGMELITLQLRSVPTSLDKWLPAPSDALIGIASRWPGFLKSARTMLVAAGFHSDRLVFRDARSRRWQQGLKDTAAVVCDFVSGKEVPRDCRVITFPLLSETAIEELRHCQKFVGAPFTGSL